MIGSAVFEKPGAQVLEAYSEFDKEPRQFPSVHDLVAYIKERLLSPSGGAFFFVLYPDMGGRAFRKTIHLDPDKVPGHSIRYTWEGWGLISIFVENGDGVNRVSRVSANSEKRAKKWSQTYSEWESPGTWNWKSVASHTRRLQRVFKALPNTVSQANSIDTCAED